MANHGASGGLNNNKKYVCPNKRIENKNKTNGLMTDLTPRPKVNHKGIFYRYDNITNHLNYDDCYDEPPLPDYFENKMSEFIRTKKLTCDGFKKLTIDHLLISHPFLTIFGSIVYDPDNAKNIDIYGSSYKMHDLIKSLKRYFSVQLNEEVDHHILEIDNTHKIYSATISYNFSFLGKIILVDTKIIKMIPCDFIETSMIKTSEGFQLGSSLRQEYLTMSINQALKNIKNKILTPTGNPVRPFPDPSHDILAPGSGPRSILKCMTLWQQGFKMKAKGYSFTHDQPGEQFVIHYEISHLTQILYSRISDPSVIIIGYLNDMCFSSDTLCYMCELNLSTSDRFPFVVKTHDQRLWHGECIYQNIKILCNCAFRGCKHKLSHRSYPDKVFFNTYAKSF